MLNTALKRKLLYVFVLSVIGISGLFSPTGVQAAGEMNLALNPSQSGFPEVTSSYTCGCDNVWSTVNGIFSFTNSPRDRWTNYGSPNSSDWVAVDFGSAKTFNQVKLYLYNDGGGVMPPDSYRVQYWNGTGWADVANPIKTPETPTAALDTAAAPATVLNTADFDAVTSSKVQIIFTNSLIAYSGLVELEVFFHQTADQIAASAVTALIEQLPDPSAVTLSDQSAVTNARTAYDNLTAAQKSLVTNLAKLASVEAVIQVLETPLTDAAVLSAFSNAARNEITLKLSSVLDTVYGIQPDRFQLIVNGGPVAVAAAVYDSSDPAGQTVKLLLSSPELLAQTSAVISVELRAFKTIDHQFNNPIGSIPVITFKRLDLTHDNLIGLEDLVPLFANPALQIDVNQDGVFNREDMNSLLGQLSSRSLIK